MCELGDLTWMPELGLHGRYIDSCMVETIREMIRTGSGPIACCCGHGKYRKTVIYRALGGNAIEYYSHKILLDKKGNPKQRRFYITDDSGQYFIPEVEEYWNWKESTIPCLLCNESGMYKHRICGNCNGKRRIKKKG